MLLKLISILLSAVLAQDLELDSESANVDQGKSALVIPQNSYFKNDFPGAIAAAKKSKRQYVLIEFGAKWCPACLKFEHDVLNSDDFKIKYNQFVHLLVDYDWDGSKEYR
ncbi:MAG: thioredoxin family protein, partial [Bdellovibrionales bacterium]|nr:thioredoxin family protein [Bdellovibrionales bacterium]